MAVTLNQTAPRAQHSPASLHYGLVVLGVVVLVVFCALGLARFGYTSILPAMQRALELSNRHAGELQSWNLLGYVATVAPAGLCAARFGPRAVIPIGLLTAACGMALTGLAPGFAAACAGRFLAGVGGAASNVPAMGLVSAWFGIRRRGLAAGIGVAGSSVGLMVTGPLIPAILERHGSDGWRVSWHVLAALTFVALIVAWALLRNRPSDLGLRPMAESEQERLLAGKQAGEPAPAWRSVYRSRRLWQLAAIYFAFGFSYIIYATFFVRHLTGGVGLSQAQAGGLWLKIGLVSVLSGFLWGSVSDRWGRRAALLWVFGLQGVAFAMFGMSREPWAVYGSAALFAVTAWSIPALMAALCGDLFGPRLAPAALGLITVVFGLGQVLGPLSAGAIADATQSFGPAFLLAGGVALVGGGGGSMTLAGRGGGSRGQRAG